MSFLGYLDRYPSIWTKFQLKPLVPDPNRDIYATTGFGLRKNREMAGVDGLVVYMQTGVKYSSLYIHHPGGDKLLYFTAVCIYTTKSSTPAISLFF